MSKLSESDRYYYGEDAINSFMTRGSCKPSGFAEYDGLSGYVDRVYVTEWMDTNGTRWRKTCTIVNLGRPDRGIVLDPDARLEAEEWESEEWGRESNGPRNTTLAYETHRLIAAARRMALQLRVVAFLMANGPSVAHCIAEGIDCKYRTLKSHFRAHTLNVAAGEEERVYCEVGKNRCATIWGVVGIHEKGKGHPSGPEAHRTDAA